MIEICLWNPDEHGRIRRSDRIPDTIPGISRFQQVVLHQGRIERFFLDSIKEHSDIVVERGVLPTAFEFDDAKAEDFNDYPINVTVRTLSDEESTPQQQRQQQHHKSAYGKEMAVSDGLFRSNLAADDTDDLICATEASSRVDLVETIKAKFLVGCDGAHSWVRRQLGFELEGDSRDYIWGVLDIVPITDFPDIRQRCAVHSANAGSVMVIHERISWFDCTSSCKQRSIHKQEAKQIGPGSRQRSSSSQPSGSCIPTSSTTPTATGGQLTRLASAWVTNSR